MKLISNILLNLAIQVVLLFLLGLFIYKVVVPKLEVKVKEGIRVVCLDLTESVCSELPF